jgi:predicted MFS family arabinose efflux permease
VVFALAGGLLGQAIGLRATFIAASVLGALSAIPALMPSLRTLREVPKAD